MNNHPTNSGEFLHKATMRFHWGKSVLATDYTDFTDGISFSLIRAFRAIRG